MVLLSPLASPLSSLASRLSPLASRLSFLPLTSPLHFRPRPTLRSAKTEQASAAAAQRAKKAKAGGAKLPLRGSAAGSKLVFGESCGSAVLDSNALMDAGELRTRLECFPHDGDTVTSEAKAKKQLKGKAAVRLKLEYKLLFDDRVVG